MSWQMEAFSSLQFVKCRFSDLREVPAVIGAMGACRMVDFSDNVITSVSENVGELHHLDTLLLRNNVSGRELRGVYAGRC